jgi:tetratricopeptide (TPR) repeat protein
MKKIIIGILFISAISLGIYKYGVENLFTPGAVKRVREKTIERLIKDTKEAEGRYKNQLEKADKVGKSYEKLGRKYLQNKNWTPGIEALNRAVEYGSSGARVHYLLGAAYANRGKELGSKDDINKAEVHYKRAIELNDKMNSARYGLGILAFYLKKETDKGIMIMKSIIRRDREYYSARFALGRFYYETGKKNRSLAVYEDLYSDLQKKKDSPLMKEYRKKTKKNISRIMMELSK